MLFFFIIFRLILACEPGYYCANTGLQNVSGKCLDGYFCTGGAITANPRNLSGDICPIGSYCLTGSILPIPCSTGTYVNYTGKYFLKFVQNKNICT